jgi:hypothetical protein
MKRLLVVVILLGVMAIITIPFAGSNNLASNSSSDRYNISERHTFTWISHVTPELAHWAQGLCFTDVVSPDNSMASYQNLLNEGITYWYCVSSWGLDQVDLTSVANLTKRLTTFVHQSLNGQVYLDDTQHICQMHGVEELNNLFSAVREVQGKTNFTLFILDGYLDLHDSYKSYLFYPQTNMDGIDFDVYKPLNTNYTSIFPLLTQAAPRTIGIYIWAYGCWKSGLAWDMVTSEKLGSVYSEAILNNATRIVVWDGYAMSEDADPCIDTSCLYNYPEWWPLVRELNMEFLQAGLIGE